MSSAQKADALKVEKPCGKCGTSGRYADGGCKECTRIYGVAYRAANQSRIKAERAEWYIKNKDKALAAHRAWRQAVPNRDGIRGSAKKWDKANPDSRRINRLNRRARNFEAGGKLSKDLSTKLFKLQKGKCPCCKQPLGDDYHMDHKMPLALGGSNTDSNMQLLRAVCNLQKNAKHPVDFMQQRGFLL